MNTLLIGLRGCGKTTVGRVLAARLRRPFIDLDEVVLASFSEPTVHAVWSVHGEPAWRAAEVRILVDHLRADGQVLALGGGTPMITAARQRMEAEQRAGRVRVVYLRCAANELARRLTRQPGDRPPLTGSDPVAEISPVLAAREPTYRRLADLELDVTDTLPEETAGQLLRWAFPAETDAE
ncbi:MAG: shikimate kinase [Planctomycetota bacterium]|jgi:shikimate kinase